MKSAGFPEDMYLEQLQTLTSLIKDAGFTILFDEKVLEWGGYFTLISRLWAKVFIIIHYFCPLKAKSTGSIPISASNLVFSFYRHS